MMARMKDKDEMSKASNDKPEDNIYILFLIHSELNGLEPKMDTFLVKVN